MRFSLNNNFMNILKLNAMFGNVFKVGGVASIQLDVCKCGFFSSFYLSPVKKIKMF